MILTDENYYSTEADLEYMSCSQYQGFCECEAKQLAKLQGRWVDTPSEAFLIGNYFHSHFESEEAHKKFCEENFDKIFRTKEITVKRATKTTEAVKETVVVGKYAPFEKTDKMIDTVMNDRLMRQLVDIPGQNEMIVVGEIFGTKWRGKLDKYIEDMRLIIDYKTVANIWETSYNPVTKMRETFVEKYGYIFRAAVYSLLEMQMSFGISFEDAFKMLVSDSGDLPEFVLVCVSKQEYPDKEVLRLNHTQEYVRSLEAIRDKLYRINLIKEGRVAPKRCGECDYCRATKQLQEIKPYYELIPGLRAPREVESLDIGT